MQSAIGALIQAAARDRIRLFIFGSFARGDALPVSDLDLGFERLPGATAMDVLRLREAVDRLPTIRPVDLVDFGEVGPDFRAKSQRFTPIAHDHDRNP
ncbi:MAG: nucleotidyltransferase domain-containing protein [Verrucomicrobiae bacterium]|nr:nucleotidyltransferase domain-containing protein [Verrucomicrobiae bacterium]